LLGVLGSCACLVMLPLIAGVCCGRVRLHASKTYLQSRWANGIVRPPAWESQGGQEFQCHMLIWSVLRIRWHSSAWTAPRAQSAEPTKGELRSRRGATLLSRLVGA